MKRIYYILMMTALAFLSSCQEPEFVLSTAERQGITSLTAYFTQGKYVEKEAGKLTIKEGENPDRYVIPIQFYYPENTDDVTTLHMTKMRVRAELAPNCKIEPPLTVLDLYLENEFVYTNAKGESKNIIITGERVPFQTAQFLSFDLVDNPEDGRTVVTGFVDNTEKIIYLFTIDDLSGLYVKANPWYHGSIKDYETLSTKPGDWNEDRVVTAIAHDGETTCDYKVLKREPSKIKYGFNAPQIYEEDENGNKLPGYWGLFNIDPYVELGVPHYDTPVFATIAYVDGYLVLNHYDLAGDSFDDGKEYTPIYVDCMNGSYKGEIVTGGLTGISAITNDEGGNLLLCNYLDEFGGEFKIYRTRSVNEAPELFYTFNNTKLNEDGSESALVSLPMGSKIKVCGNLDAEAVIVVPFDGLPSVSESGQFLNIKVVGGSVVSADIIDVLSSSGVSWGSAPTHTAGIVPLNAAGTNGWFYGQYNQINGIQWIKPNLELGKSMVTGLVDVDGDGVLDEGNADDHSWLIRPGTLDCKHFNNATYMVHLNLHFYPAWEEQPSVYVYDVADPATVTGRYFQESSAIVAYDSWITYYNNKSAYNDPYRTCGDVVMAQSADGLRLFIYCYDHHANVLCGYAADCVKRK